VKRLSIALVLLLAACSADLTLPPKIDGVVPPTPENFQVTSSDNITFDLSWAISDPTVIRFYHVYVLLPTGVPELFDTSFATSKQYSTDPPWPVPGIVFGVSSVSNDNIESSLVVGWAE
jgi:hypothetical protein